MGCESSLSSFSSTEAAVVVAYSRQGRLISEEGQTSDDDVWRRQGILADGAKAFTFPPLLNKQTVNRRAL